jgi:hypothetical protein
MRIYLTGKLVAVHDFEVSDILWEQKCFFDFELSSRAIDGEMRKI